MVCEVLVYFVFAGLCCLALRVYYRAWLLPERIRGELRRQGIGGPPPAFLTGNLPEMKKAVMEERERGEREAAAADGRRPIVHDYTSTVFPYFVRWRKVYGPVFTYTMGEVVALHVSQPEVVRDINLCTSLDLGKATHLKRAHEPLFGDGILKANGESWARQRRVIAPELFGDRVRSMVDLMAASAAPLVASWEAAIDRSGGAATVVVDAGLSGFSSDVISRACFGRSYAEVEHIFVKMKALQEAVAKPNLLLETTGLGGIPTKRSRKAWKLNEEVSSLIMDLVKEDHRSSNPSSSTGNLLQAILHSAVDIGADAERFIVDNCKSIFFAGYETTAVTATWCLMLLALHPEWQRLARAEALAASGTPPDWNSIQRLKVITMVILETLRLYPPGAYVTREALRDVELGGIAIPRGVNIYVPVSELHHDAAAWGDNAAEFDPGRFAGGVAAACRVPHMYAPFGAGGRTCVGQGFAMAELKVVMSVLLARFEFSVSPGYRHSPALRLIVEPEFGVELIIRKVVV